MVLEEALDDVALLSMSPTSVVVFLFDDFIAKPGMGFCDTQSS
jgi:hypothetical protein